MHELIMAKHSITGRKKNTTSIELTQEESNALKVFEKYKHIYDFYMKTDELVNFHIHVQSELLTAYQVWHPHYNYNKSCIVCVCEFLEKVYRFYLDKIQ